MTKTLGESVQPGQDLTGLPRSLRIMVVDDDRDMVLTLKTILRDEGHEVWGVYRAGDVQLGVKHFDPDVLMLDIALPDGSGYALADSIRAQCGRDRPMIIALTGLYREGPDKSISKSIGIDHFLTKPFATDRLLELITPLTLRSNAA
jgi:DNA-binding response OmpR family regulator